MRRQFVFVMTLLTWSVTAPARAQFVNIASPQPAQMSPDVIVARLMSFDINHDGKVARAELPERMQPLLTRGDVGEDDALDGTELRRLAETPPPVINARVQPGRYGFIDEGFGFDSTQHIDGAIDDLRLASATREKAMAVAKTFQEGRTARANADLIATMTKLLNPVQLAEFKDAFDGKPLSVPAIQVGGVMFFGATAQEAAGQRAVLTRVRSMSFEPARVIQRADLPDSVRQEAMEAIEQYQARMSGRLVDVDRHALLHQLRDLLDDQQRDDLRAALERRPLAKQGASVQVFTTFTEVVRPQPASTFQIQNLLLVR
jgi:hypothetical protein